LALIVVAVIYDAVFPLLFCTQWSESSSKDAALTSHAKGPVSQTQHETMFLHESHGNWVH